MQLRQISYGVMLSLAMGSVAYAADIEPVVFADGDSMFNDFDNGVSSTAACLVASDDKGPGLAACLCGINRGFMFCSDAAVTKARFQNHPTFAGAIAAELEIDSLEYNQISPLPDAGSSFTLDVRGTCDMTQGSLELALDPGYDRQSLKGILGAKAQYSAVYMFPYAVVTELGSNSVVKPLGEPVRLCGMGQVNALAAGQRQNPGRDRTQGVGSATADLSVSNIGLTSGYEWAVEAMPEHADSVGVEFVVVAGVAAGNLKINKQSFNAIGVLANAAIHNASMKIELHEGIE